MISAGQLYAQSHTCRNGIPHEAAESLAPHDRACRSHGSYACVTMKLEQGGLPTGTRRNSRFTVTCATSKPTGGYALAY